MNISPSKLMFNRDVQKVNIARRKKKTEVRRPGKDLNHAIRKGGVVQEKSYNGKVNNSARMECALLGFTPIVMAPEQELLSFM